MNILEEFRPRSLDDFIGNRTAIRLARAYFDDKTGKGAMIFSGQPGTGKTTLAHLLAHDYGYQPLEQNAAQERRKRDVGLLLADMQTESLDGLPTLLIMDEAEVMPTAVIDLLIARDDPIIFIVNELHKFKWKQRQKCHVVSFKQPTATEYQTLIDDLGEDISPKVISQFQSWRDLLNYIEGGEPRGAICMTDFDEIRTIFTEGWTENWEPIVRTRYPKPASKSSGYVPGGPNTMIDYFLFNGGDPEFVSRLDHLIHEGKLGRRRAADLLMQVRMKKLKRQWIYFPPRGRSKREKMTIRIEAFIPLSSP